MLSNPVIFTRRFSTTLYTSSNSCTIISVWLLQIMVWMSKDRTGWTSVMSATLLRYLFDKCFYLPLYWVFGCWRNHLFFNLACFKLDINIIYFPLVHPKSTTNQYWNYGLLLTTIVTMRAYLWLICIWPYILFIMNEEVFFRASLDATVKLLSCDFAVTCSSRRINLLAKCKVRCLHWIHKVSLDFFFHF